MPFLPISTNLKLKVNTYLDYHSINIEDHFCKIKTNELGELCGKKIDFFLKKKEWAHLFNQLGIGIICMVGTFQTVIELGGKAVTINSCNKAVFV